MQHNFFKTALYCLIGIQFFCLNTGYAQPGCTAVINAISINPGDCNGGVDCDNPSEYIEIFNPCFEPIELGCSTICEGSWCVTVPSGTTLMPGEYLSVGSATSPGFDAENAAHLNMHNCESCAWLNPAAEAVELGALSDDSGQVALFDADSQLLKALVWGGGQSPGQQDFPVSLNIEESNGCVARTLTLPNPAANTQFTEISEVGENCSFVLKINNQINPICESDGGDISMGASNLKFSPYTINGCLYTGETVNISLNAEGMTGSWFWTIPCTNEFTDMESPSVDVFCDLPGTKTIHVLVSNDTNGHTYQYQEDIVILRGLDYLKELQDQEVCLGENINFDIPVVAGLDSQMVVVNSPPNEPQTLTENFTVDIQNIEQTSTITFTGFGGGESCSFTKEVTFSVLAEDNPNCVTPVENYTMLLAASVYPNPAKNIVQIQYELKQPMESSLSLYNVFGQIVNEQTIFSNAGINLQSMDIKKLPDGVYMLSLAIENEASFYKFIKE